MRRLRSYLLAFKWQCLQLVAEHGVCKVSRQANIPESTLSDWLKDKTVLGQWIACATQKQLKTVKRLPKGFARAMALSSSASPAFDSDSASTSLQTSQPIVSQSQSKSAMALCRKQYARFPEQEQQLFDWVMKLSETGFQITILYIRLAMYSLMQSLGETSFKASVGWATNFMTRHNLVLRRPTSSNLKHLPLYCRSPNYPPAQPPVPITNCNLPIPSRRNYLHATNPTFNFAESVQAAAMAVRADTKVAGYFHHASAQVMANNYPLSLICNMDECGVELDMVSRKTIAIRGSKQVVVRDSRATKTRFSVVGTVAADGSKLAPLCIFKGAPGGTVESNLRQKVADMGLAVDVCCQMRGYMDERTILDEYFPTIERRVASQSESSSSAGEQRTLLLLDCYNAHRTARVKAAALDRNIDLAIIPGGYTPFLQPLDVGVFKPFKDRLRVLWARWILDPQQHSFIAKSGNLKSPEPSRLCQWVAEAWQSISQTIVVNAFRRAVEAPGQ